MLVRSHGGRCLRKSIKEEGRVREYIVYDLCGKLIGLPKTSGSHYTTLSSDQVKESALAMAKEYVNITGLLGQKR